MWTGNQCCSVRTRHIFLQYLHVGFDSNFGETLFEFTLRSNREKNRWYAQPFSKQEIDHDRAANDMLACVRCVRPWLVRHDTTGISLTNDLMLIYNHSGARTVFCETCEDFAPKYRHQTPRLLFELVLVE